MPVKLDNFKKTVVSTKVSRTYSDLHLDLVEDKSTSDTVLRDIKADYDLAAIKNSLTNIFNTTPGQKILNPVFGLSLMNFLFEPISEAVGTAIGNAIITGIQTFEPRVRVEKIYVEGQPDDNSYVITLIISIPSLNIKQINIVGTLNNGGYTVS
jgi:phage baseplate assembly protein W